MIPCFYARDARRTGAQVAAGGGAAAGAGAGVAHLSGPLYPSPQQAADGFQGGASTGLKVGGKTLVPVIDGRPVVPVGLFRLRHAFADRCRRSAGVAALLDESGPPFIESWNLASRRTSFRGAAVADVIKQRSGRGLSA
jgi:hypothetical protein